MKFTELPIDADDMFRGLKICIECVCPTYDSIADNRLMELADYELAAMGATKECKRK